jgi:hypothetical protein
MLAFLNRVKERVNKEMAKNPAFDDCGFVGLGLNYDNSNYTVIYYNWDLDIREYFTTEDFNDLVQEIWDDLRQLRSNTK